MKNNLDWQYQQDQDFTPLDSFNPSSLRPTFIQQAQKVDEHQSVLSPHIEIKQENQTINSSVAPSLGNLQKKGFFQASQKFKLLTQKQSERQLIKNIHSQNRSSQQSFFRLIQRQAIIKRFLDKLKQQAYIFPLLMHDEQKKILQENYVLNEKDKLRPQNLNQHNQHRIFKTINPLGYFSIFWSLFRILLVLFLMWWFPFKVAFNPQINNQLQWAENTLIYIFLIDVLIKVNSGFIKEGEMIINRILIIKYYISNELVVDLFYFITQLILIEDLADGVYSIEEIMVLVQFFMNFFKLKKKVNRLEEAFITESTYLEISNLFQLILLVVYFAHLMACIWYYVGNVSINIYDVCWITDISHQYEQNIIILYIYSFYWATVTMVTVGYGDITPQNPIERLCAIILLICSTGIFAFAINQIGSIFSSLDAEKQSYKKNLLIVNQYMKQNNVDLQVQSRVRNSLKFQHKVKGQISSEQIDQIFSKLPQGIYDDVKKNIQLRIVQEIDFYKQNFTENVLSQISKSLQLLYFTPKEIIFNQNEIDDCSLYTVWKGEVQIVDIISGKILSTLTKGQCFGEIEFIHNQERKFTAISKDLTQILKMPKDKFEKIISTSQQDFEKFHKMKYDLMFNKQNIISKCYCCQNQHFILDCRIISYIPNIFKIINLANGTENNNRQNFDRNKIKKTFCKLKSNNSQELDQYYESQQSVNRKQDNYQIQESEEYHFKRDNSATRKRRSQIKGTVIHERTNQLILIEEENSQDTLQLQSSINGIKQDSKQFVEKKSNSKKFTGIFNQKQKQQQNSSGKIVTIILDQLDQLQNEFSVFIKIEMDKQKQYILFNPQNNINQVIEKINNIQKKQQQKIKRLSQGEVLNDKNKIKFVSIIQKLKK